MPTIVEIVEAEVANITADTREFAHGSKNWQNLVADSANFPIVYLDEPIESTHDIQANNSMNEVYTLTMLFGSQGALDNTPDQDQSIIQLSRTAAYEFVKNMRARKVNAATGAKKTFELIEGVIVKDVMNFGDACVTGVMLTMTVTLTDKISLC